MMEFYYENSNHNFSSVALRNSNKHLVDKFSQPFCLVLCNNEILIRIVWIGKKLPYEKGGLHSECLENNIVR
jgi:hypothetical protein